MKIKFLPIKRALRFVLLILLLAAVGKVNAQYYSYEPALGEYYDEGTTSDYVVFNNINYSNCNFLSSTKNYWQGHVNTCLYSHNTSTGLMKFRIAKCDNNYYFGSGSSGKIMIVENGSSLALCEEYSISGSSTHYITKSFYHSNFSGTCYFDVFLVTSNLVNYYYAGRVIVRRAYAPVVQTGDAENVTFTSAQLNGYVNPQGLPTTHYFQWGTSPSFGENGPDYTYYSDYSNHWVSLGISGLQPGTTYYYRVRAYNDAGSDIGDTYSFTTQTQYYPPEVTTGDATDISSYSAKINGTVNPQGLTTTAWFDYGTTTSMNDMTDSWIIESDDGYNFTTFPAQKTLYGLQPNTRYYFRIHAYNSQGESYGTRKYFWTDAGGNPIVTTGDATSITSTSATISGTINPQGLITNYYFNYGTTANYELGHTVTATLSQYTTNQTVSAELTGLLPNTTYHYQLYASNDGGAQYGSDRTFTTEENQCYFVDCTSGEIHDAALFLCERGIVTGYLATHTLEPGNAITRAQLAKAAFFGLYSNSSGVNIPDPLVTDYFPCIYPDLQENSYYYQAAKALLYLEYGDGISPFDRDKSCFNPNGTIKRRHVLKVLLETFNIPPAEFDGEEPFYPYYLHDEDGWGYVKKAKDLNILNLEGTTDPHPWDNCTRGQAFLFLYRILLLIDNNTITKPTPNYDTYNPLNSDFFVPTNLSPQVANAIRGVEYGNFNYYNKDFFNIPGYMNLDFGISYNSYLTEMPDEFYPVKPLGKAWTHTYDMYMNVITDNYNNISYYAFHMQNGALLIYKSDNGNLAKYTEGNYYVLTPTTLNANTYTLKSTGQISYTFTKKSDGIYYLTQIKDRHDNAITVNIGSNNNGHYRVNSVSTLGRTLTFGYTSDTLLSYVKDPINRYVRFYYYEDDNSLKQLSTVKDAKNQITWFHYGTLDSEKGLLKEVQMPKGNYVYNDYQRRKLKSMSYVGLSTQTHMDIAITPNYQNGTTTSTVTERLNNNQNVTTNYTMNDKNRVTHVSDDLNTDISYQYGVGYPDNPDLLTQKTNNKTGLQTSYAYDASNGLMTSITYSDGSETHNMHVLYNDYNDITEYTDANNNTTYYGYNNYTHNMISITDALGKITYIDYDNDGHGVPIRVTNPMGTSIEYGYNSYGNLNEISIPSLNVNATITYDGISRMNTKTDFAGKTTSYTYDNNDNLETITDADGNTTTYNYDANDNVTWIQNANGKKTNFTYDSNTDFLTQMSFQGYTRNYTYNRDGSLNTFTNPNGQTFNYTYNNSGELSGDGYASLQYYSSTGRLWKVTKDGMPITYTYDSFDRISSIAYDGKTVSYTYDNNGNVKTIVYPGNKTVTYTYDALNRMTSVKDWNNKTTTYNYRDDGQLNYYQYPNQVRTTYSYDNSGRYDGFSTKRNSGNGSVIAEYSFVLDNMGNHISETITEPYDAYPSIPSENITYNYNAANRLTSAGDLSFAYDANGNTITRTGRTYDYDVYNQLTSVSGDFTASYIYDGLGNRRSATRNGTTTKYVLNLLGSTPTVLMETDANGAVQNYYVYGATGLISRIDANNNTRYYVYDFRGSTVAMTEATTSANITHKYQYDDFGKVLQSEEADLNRFRYVGKMGVMYEDDALVFMRARFYDPEIGHFLSEDPIWSTNLYPYANNNPITWIDPKGELSAAVQMLGGGIDLLINGYGLYDFGMSIIDGDAIDQTLSVVGLVGGAVFWPVGVFCTGVSHMKKYDVPNKIGNGMEKFWDWALGDAVDRIIEKRNQKKATAQAATQASAPTFQIDREAMDFIFGSSDPYAKRLKELFIGFHKSDWSQEKKYAAYQSLYRRAREYMSK